MPWLDLKDLLVKDLLFEGLLRTGRTRVCPRLQLNLRVIWHLEVPVGLYATQILEGECDPAWLRPILDRHLPKVPRKLAQVGEELFLATSQLVRVVIGDLGFGQRQQQLLVHFCELEAFPKICDADLVVADVSEAEEGVVTFAVDLDGGLLDVAPNWLFQLAVFLLELDRGA